MAYFGGEFAITASATKVTTALGLTSPLKAVQVDIKNAAGAANTLYLGPSTVTTSANRRAELTAGQSFSFQASLNTVNTDEIYLVGTANAANIAFITVVT